MDGLQVQIADEGEEPVEMHGDVVGRRLMRDLFQILQACFIEGVDAFG